MKNVFFSTTDHDAMKYSINIPHHSVDSVLKSSIGKSSNINCKNETSDLRSTENADEYTLLQRRDVLHKAENQFRSLMISSTSNLNKDTLSSHIHQHDYQNLTFDNNPLLQKHKLDDTTGLRNSRLYDLSRSNNDYNSVSLEKY